MKTLCGFAILAAGAMLLIGCDTGNSPGETNVVKMTSSMRYEPAEITVKVGETVRWKNASFMPHTVTADPSLAKKAGDAMLPPGATPFNSGNIGIGKSFDYTFAAPGMYKYFCIPHESQGMVGTVIVKPPM